MKFESLGIKYNAGEIFLLDQQKLPHIEDWIKIINVQQMIDAIKSLKVRGAPMIGVAASFSLAQLSKETKDLEAFYKVAYKLRESRPTAVNLMVCIDKILGFVKSKKSLIEVESMAIQIALEDRQLCEDMANTGAELIKDGMTILTHCNTGGVATAGLGTALGVIVKAHQQNKKIKVYVDETRPLLQGARLTAWELEKAGIEFELICDNMAGHLMSLNKIDQVWVGSDRISINGDFANKIGTYSLAVLAQYHNVDFYVAAPKTTIDFSCKSGNDIPIELREASEIHGVSLVDCSLKWAKSSFSVYNPAFDVTPFTLVTGMLINDKLFSKKDFMNNKILELQ